MKIEKGSIVEWRVTTAAGALSSSQPGCSHSDGSEEDKRDISSIRHVVAFETPQLAQTESNILRVNDTFKVRFIENGSYSYRCQIQPRMRGNIKVFDNVHQILSSQAPPVPKLGIKQAVFGFTPVQDKSFPGEGGAASVSDKHKVFSQSELSQRLVEVLEEEKELDSTPFIKKGDLKAYFDK